MLFWVLVLFGFVLIICFKILIVVLYCWLFFKVIFKLYLVFIKFGCNFKYFWYVVIVFNNLFFWYNWFFLIKWVFVIVIFEVGLIVFVKVLLGKI